MRIVFLLDAAFPRTFDVNQLVLADHLVVHSAENGGPPSLHPPLSISEGELGLKRALVQKALQMMSHSGLVEVLPTDSGITFQAAERTYGFVKLFNSDYATRLRSITAWVLEDFADENAVDSLRRMQVILSNWADQRELPKSKKDGQVS